MRPFYDEQSEVNFRALQQELATRQTTVFIGAGLSVPAGLPTWSVFFKSICEMALGPGHPDCQEFDPASGPLQLNRFRAALGESSYLQVIRSLVDQPIVKVPESYLLLRQAFGSFATTNYDNFLKNLALTREREKKPEIQIYPEIKLGARYLYLHGHAGTARGMHDLVVCQEDYDRAYEIATGPARQMLMPLLQQGPCVFVGSSLEDPDLVQILRQATGARHTYGSLGGRFQEIYEASPPWFALFSANPGEYVPVSRSDLLSTTATPDEMLRRGTEHYVKTRTAVLQAFGVRAIWYHPDRTHSNLLVLLRRLVHGRSSEARSPEEPVFLLRATELEELGSIDEPTEEQETRVVELVRAVPEYRRHFYANATSPAWLSILQGVGILPGIDEPRVDPSGRAEITQWEAAPYILRLASTNPQMVADFICGLRTLNWHALSVLAESVTLLPSQMVPAVVPTIADWLSTPYATAGFVEYPALQLIRQQLSASDSRSALLLVRALLRPAQPSGGGSTTRLPLAVTVELPPLIPALAEASPDETIELFESLLAEAVRDEIGERSSDWSAWRAAIEQHRRNLPAQSRPDLLVDALRDSLVSLGRTQPARAAVHVLRLLRSGISLNRRIAISVATAEPSLLPLTQDELFAGESFFDVDAFHETMVLLNRHYSRMSRRMRAKIGRLLQAGPTVEGAADGERRGLRDRWRWYALSVLPPQRLTRQQQLWLSELQAQWDSPSDPYFLVTSRSWVYSSPTSAGALRAIADEGMNTLVAVLRDPASRFSIQEEHSPELIWETLASLIPEIPEQLLGLAPLIDIRDFDEGRAWYYLNAYAQAARDGRGFSWAPLLDLCERVLGQARHRERHPQHWAWAVARFLRDGVLAATRIPDSDLGRVAGVLEPIADAFTTTLDSEPRDDTRHDLLSNQLNDPGGIACDGILRVASRCLEASTSPISLDQSQQVTELTNQVVRLVDRAVKDGWGGIEMRVAIGWHLAIIERLRPGWVKENKGTLLPFDQSVRSINARRGFWAGYLASNGVYSEFLQGLHDEYADAIRGLAGEGPASVEREELQRRLVEHVIIGYLRDVPGFGSGGLVDLLGGSAPDELLAYVAQYLARSLMTATEQGDTDWSARLWSAMDEYWRWRVDALRASLEPDAKSREAGSFSSWLEVAPVSATVAEDRIAFAVEHAVSGYELEDVANFLMKHLDDGIGPVSRLALILVRKWATDPEIVWRASILDPLLRGIWKQGGDSERATVREAVALLLQERGMDFRDIFGE